jgi:hypothetical protein
MQSCLPAGTFSISNSTIPEEQFDHDCMVVFRGKQQRCSASFAHDLRVDIFDLQ